MAKKNALREIKALSIVKTSNRVKPKNQNPRWEAWQCRGNAENLENWRQVWEGTLDDCFESLGEEINCQLEDAMNQNGNIDKIVAKYDHESEVLVEILEKLLAPGIAKLKAQCLENGECQGQGWTIVTAPSKLKQQIQDQYPFAYSDEWMTWEELGEKMEDWDEELDSEDEEFDDDPDGDTEEDDSFGNWAYIADGSLSNCLDSVMFFLTVEVEVETGNKKLSDDMEESEIENFFQDMAKLRSQKLQTVKKACLSKGEYRGQGWMIRSARTREQCEWLAKNGYLAVN